MKYIKLLLVIAFCGCNNTETPDFDLVPDTVLHETILGDKIKVYTIDGCQYIYIADDRNWSKMSHKGNCKYCLQRNNYNKSDSAFIYPTPNK